MIRALLAALLVLYPATMKRAVDGDTLEATLHHQLRPNLVVDETVHVRLDCYNAPERNQDGGTEATKRLATFLDGGTGIRTQWKLDKYGRLLGEPYRGDAGFCSNR